ncbi:NMS protein, partial [Atrichornis clamosus]|nr:NMS protein [Atrichornis clamosus]
SAMPSPALSWLLAACCLCALPQGSGMSEGMMDTLLIFIFYFLKQLALCFSQWMEMSDQPQISSTVLDLCYSIFNSMHKNE